MEYIVLQVVLKEKLWGAASKNLNELQDVINAKALEGYILHSFSTASSGSRGFFHGDRIQATMVFRKNKHI